MTRVARTQERQSAAADPGRHAWVSACAGAGKTTVLIDRVARLLLADVRPSAILCLTYTKAAAREIQERLFNRLGTWCVADDRDLRAALAGLHGAEHSDTGLARARGLFADALETPGGLSIQTIHAFCARLLRRFPLEAGVPTGFSEIEETETAVLMGAAIAGLCRDARRDTHLAAALERTIVEAGGTGIDMVVSAVCREEGILSRERASMGETLRLALKAPGDDADALLARIMGEDLPRSDLRDFPARLAETGKATDKKLASAIEAALGTAPDAERYHDYRSALFTGKNAPRKHVFTKNAGETSPLLGDLFASGFPEGREITRMTAADHAMRARIVYERSMALAEVGAHVRTSYREAKHRRGALDFDDLIRKSLNLLSHAQASSWVLWKLDGGVGDLLIDEAQDTSPLQWDVLTALTGEFFAGQGRDRKKQHSFFAVGDARQSIYSFHGAIPGEFSRQRQKFVSRTEAAQTPPHIEELDVSFRSAPEILAVVDAVCARIAEIEGPANDPDPPSEFGTTHHYPSRETARGRVEVWLPEKPPEDIDDTPENSPKERLARRIADHVARALTENIPVGDDNRPLIPGDIMILLPNRTSGMFAALHKALRRRGIPVAGADRIRLTESLAVQDALTLIRFALRPEDDLAVAELLTSPFCRLNEDDDLFPLAYQRGSDSLWSRLCASTSPGHLDAIAFLRSVHDRRYRPPFEFLTGILDHPGPSGQSGRDSLLERLGPTENMPLDILIDRAMNAPAGQQSSLQHFLHWIEGEQSDVKRDMSTSNDVRVMTIHGAKGSEAPFVILPDCSGLPRPNKNGLFFTDTGLPVWPGKEQDDCPASAALRKLDKARTRDEYYRLLYVAMTRARDRLIVTGPWSGGNRSKTGYASESWLDLCQMAMSNLHEAKQAVRTETGDYVAGETSPPAFDTSSPLATGTSPSLPGWLHRPAAQEKDAPGWLAPSRHEPAAAMDHSKRTPDAIDHGRIIHELLAYLAPLPRSRRADEAEACLRRLPSRLARAFGENAKATALSVLDNRAFAPVFAPHGRSEVPVIGTITDRSGRSVPVDARLDRLIVEPDSVRLVDFKTDQHIPDRPEDCKTAYLAQMASYDLLLKTLYPDKKIVCTLLWTSDSGPRLMDLPQNLLAHHRT